MNEPHLTYPLAKPADGYVKLIHGSVDIKVIDAVFDPTHRITAHPEPLEHVGGQGYRVDPVYRLAMLPMIFTMCIAFFVVHGSDPFAVKELAFIYLEIGRASCRERV